MFVKRFAWRLWQSSENLKTLFEQLLIANSVSPTNNNTEDNTDTKATTSYPQQILDDLDNTKTETKTEDNDNPIDNPIIMMASPLYIS